MKNDSPKFRNTNYTFEGKRIFLGRYDKLEDAIQARKDAEEKYFKPILDIDSKRK